MNEKIRLALLGELTAALQDGKRPYSDLNALDVVFSTMRGRELARMSVVKALDCLVNDIYTFEDFDLRDARSLTVTCV